ncbi:MAG: hypothetical protein KDA20_08490 [Phycisphaerales bacterium]|nr:hypothetical protein [Phycisphaerales bacterium]
MLSLAAASPLAAQDAATAGEEPQVAWPTLEPIARLRHEGAGRSAYDRASNMLFVVGDKGIAVIHMGRGDDAAIVRTINPAIESGVPEPEQATITSVVCDPRGRGVAMATVVPKDHALVPGRAIFFDTRTGKALANITVGYEPVYALWSFGGGSIHVANKGSAVKGRKDIAIDPPGTLSWIDVDELSNAAAFESLAQASVTIITPGGEALASGLPALRITPALRQSPDLDLEPTALAEAGNWLFVSFQANNAVGMFDLVNGVWRSILGLTPIEQRLDACATDGPSVAHELATLPMPNEIAVPILRDGDAYIVTANAGAIRGRMDRSSEAPYPDAAALMWMAKSKLIRDDLFPQHMLGYDGVGALEVCARSGDEDGDGVIERPCALGSRSLSLWNVTTGALVGDTGSAFEDAMTQSPRVYNTIGPRVDAASTERGPEPSAMRVTKVGGVWYAFVGLAHPGAIAVVDLTDARAPKLVDLRVSAMEGDFGVPALTLVPAAVNPTGSDLLIGSFAASGTVEVWRIVPPVGSQ